MLRAVREALETYASGMGMPAADVIREFKALPEAAKFEVLAKIKDLEKAHQAYVARAGRIAAGIACGGEKCRPDNCICPGRLPMPVPETDGERAAREMRAEYLRTGIHPGRQSSLIVDRHGRPHRRE